MEFSYPRPNGRMMPEELIPRLCRESGRWLLRRLEGDCYIVQANDHRGVLEISVRDSSESYTVLFQAWFSVRFSLQNPPSGLFGRLLLRNLDLHFAAWSLSIGGSCEACPSVAALVPRSALNAFLFDRVCTEIRDEILSFHAELHEKFSYSAPTPVGHFDGGPAEVRYVEPEPMQPTLPSAAEAWRIIQQAGGSVRYRLPKPGE